MDLAGAGYMGGYFAMRLFAVLGCGELDDEIWSTGPVTLPCGISES